MTAAPAVARGGPQDRLIEAHAVLVQQIAAALWARVGPVVGGQMEYADLVGYGTLGLARAAARWDARRGVQFGAYARVRIWGAMVDGLRQWDRLPRAWRGAALRGERVAPQMVALDADECECEVADPAGCPLAVLARALGAEELLVDPGPSPGPEAVERRARAAERMRRALETWRNVG